MAAGARAALAGLVAGLLAAALAGPAYQAGSNFYFRTMCGPACERNGVAGILGIAVAAPIMFLGIGFIGMQLYRFERIRRLAVPIAVAIGAFCAFAVAFVVELTVPTP